MDRERQLFICKNTESLALLAVSKWSELAFSAAERAGNFTVALSGGKTPILFYQKLAGRGDSLPWEITHIFLADERFVSRESELSNYRLVRETLISHIPIPPANIHPVPTDLDNPRIAAAEYEGDLRSHFSLQPGKLPVFNLIVLGVGGDGHTASLFPGHSGLSEEQRLVVTEVSPDTVPPRVSLTLPVLNRAAYVLFLVSGKSKASVLRRVIERRERGLPAALVDPPDGELVFAVDEEAASELSLHLK